MIQPIGSDVLSKTIKTNDMIAWLDSNANFRSRLQCLVDIVVVPADWTFFVLLALLFGQTMRAMVQEVETSSDRHNAWTAGKRPWVRWLCFGLLYSLWSTKNAKGSDCPAIPDYLQTRSRDCLTTIVSCDE